MRCPACGHENPEGAKFCNECAAKIELSCPRCAKINPPESKFCNECGQDLRTLNESTPIEYDQPQVLHPQTFSR